METSSNRITELEQSSTNLAWTQSYAGKLGLKRLLLVVDFPLGLGDGIVKD